MGDYILYKHYCTVGDLLETIDRLKNKGLSDEEIQKVPVIIERIEDHYFENQNWKTIPRGESNYILAWSPLIFKDSEGRHELAIDAHY